MFLSTQDRVWKTAAVWAAVVAAAAVVYFVGISHELIWYDEAVAVAIAQHGVADIFRLLPNENHPPLYFLLLRLAELVLGNAEWALRFVSAAAAVGMVGLGAGPVRRIVGNRGALVYAAVVVFTPVILIQAHEARMYSIGDLAVTAAVLYGFLAARQGSRRTWVAFGLWSLAAAYLHYYGLIAAVVAHAFVLGWALFRNRKQIKRSLVTSALTLAGYLPWVAVLASQTLRVNESGFWIPPVSGLAILSAILRPFVYRELYPTPLPVVRPWMAAAVVVAAALVVVGLVRAARRKETTDLTFGIMVLVTYLGTMAVAILISLVSVPVFYSRYMVVCTGLVALLMAMGVRSLPRWWMQGAVIVLVAALNVPTMIDVYTRQFNMPFKQVRQALSEEIKPGDVIITSDCFTVGPSFIYFPQAVIYYSSNTIEAKRDEIVKVMSPPLRYNEGLTELLSGRDVFWALTDSTGLCRDTPDIIQDEQGWELAGAPQTFSDPAPYSFVSFTLAKYVRPSHMSAPDRGKLKINVTGIRTPGRLVVEVFSGMPPSDQNTVRRQLLDVTPGQTETTLYDLPYGDYVLALFVDQNGNYAPDFTIEGVWLFNGEKVDPKVGFFATPFDDIKLSLHEPERDIEAKLSYPR